MKIASVRRDGRSALKQYTTVLRQLLDSASQNLQA